MRSIPLLSAGVLALAAMVGCSAPGPAAPSGSNASPSQQSAAQSSSPPQPTLPPTAQGESGVAGRTMVDGGCPVEHEASPCPQKPVSARITVVLAGTGTVVTVVISDAEGRFRVGLPPGSYVLNAVNLTGAPYPRSSPVDVVVHSGGFTDVSVSFDSGIQ
jgi:hypothetical protein